MTKKKTSKKGKWGKVFLPNKGEKHVLAEDDKNKK